MFIAVDLDDTLVEFISAFWDWHEINYGWKVEYHQMTSYFLPEVVKKHLGIDISYDTLHKRGIEFHSQDIETLLEVEKPTKHSLTALKKLKQYASKLIILTARDKIIKHTTEAWVQTYFPNIFDDIIFTNQFETKSLLDVQHKKAEICQLLNIDVLIDDAPHYFVEFPKLKKKGIVYPRPWNKNVKTSSYVIRAKDWQNIESILLSNFQNA